jgi:hypothetical protein
MILSTSHFFAVAAEEVTTVVNKRKFVYELDMLREFLGVEFHSKVKDIGKYFIMAFCSRLCHFLYGGSI